jgi:hypothetical protein
MIALSSLNAWPLAPVENYFRVDRDMRVIRANAASLSCQFPRSHTTYPTF